MKLLITSVVLAAMVASPALARTKSVRALSQEAAQARAQAPNEAVNVPRINPWNIHLGGAWIGADPDPNVRQQLVQEYFHRWQ